jgi:asparagine synthase (glutamine-hydrolysing)
MRDSAALGQCMLWSTPESLSEHQPLVDATGDRVIVADARIDNREELYHELRLRRRPLSQLADSALILAAHERWGEDCVARLLGDFAFAIWTRRRQRLFCVRDHFGVKPLYYFRAPGFFLFASEIKAILSLRQVPWRINEPRVADYLVPELEGIDRTSTFYRDIYRLEPASWLSVERKRAVKHRYWCPEPTDELRLGSDDEYAEAFREVFAEAVRCRLRSASPPGSMLSGGMDSSAIVGVARQLLREDGREPLRTFSAISAQGADCAETRFIFAVITQGGLEAITVRPDQIEPFLPAFERLLYRADDLFDHLIAHVPLVMYAAAHDMGVKVLLDGIDGDLVTSLGDYYIAHLLRRGQWRAAIQETQGRGRFLYRFNEPTWKILYRHARPALTPSWLRGLRRTLRQRLDIGRRAAPSIISPEFAKRIELNERLEALRGFSQADLGGNINRIKADRLCHPWLQAGLERYDRVAALLSIEPRHPIMDKRLIELCMTFPWQQQIHQGWSKINLRRSVRGLLPDEVVWRKGWEHLGYAFSLSLYRHMKDRLEDFMDGHLESVAEFIDTNTLRQSRKRFLARGDLTAGAQVWTAFSLHVWLQRANRGCKKRSDLC